MQVTSGSRVHWKGDVENGPRDATVDRVDDFFVFIRFDGAAQPHAMPLAVLDNGRWSLIEAVKTATPGEEIAALIPAPVKASLDGTAIPYWNGTYPRSKAYEAAVAPLLPAGWKLYSVVDGESHPATCAKDFGATRGDVAHVFGVRDVDGTPKHLRAHVASGSVVRDGAEKIFPPHVLAEACRWCDERIAGQEER